MSAMIPNDPVVIVTGASRGVGRATAKELANGHGRTVLAIARDAERLHALQAECAQGPGRIEPLALDLAGASAPIRTREALAGRRVLGLVNAAGLLIKRDFGAWTAEDAQRLFHVNAVVPLLLAQALQAELGGTPPAHIVNIGSMGGFQGSVKFPGLALYSASKAAVASLTECMAEEFKDHGIRCNCLSIGAVDTDMLREAFPGYQAPISAASMGAYVARFVLDGHNYFNGKVLPVALSTP
ncbi:MAG: SDR family oxidoreductase [Flavobacteriales bacterium]